MGTIATIIIKFWLKVLNLFSEDYCTNLILKLSAYFLSLSFYQVPEMQVIDFLSWYEQKFESVLKRAANEIHALTLTQSSFSAFTPIPRGGGGGGHLLPAFRLSSL